MKIQELLRQLVDELTKIEQPAQDPSELKQDAVMVPPLQQEIEISKAQAGKDSEVINQLTQSEITHTATSDSGGADGLLADLLKIAGVAAKPTEQQADPPANDFNTQNPAAVIVIPNNSNSR